MKFTKQDTIDLKRYIVNWFKANKVSKTYAFNEFTRVYQDKPIKDRIKAFYWKVFWLSGVSRIIDFYDKGYNDDHIYTALKYIMKGL